MHKTKPAAKAATPKPTRVVVLLDRTGSMSSVKQETITGFNAYLDTLKKAGDQTTISIVQFDSQSIDKLCDGVKVKAAPRLNDEIYQPRAMTPLYDALGKTLVSTKESSNGSKVLFVILTDGQENASTEWTDAKVKVLMKEREDKDNWTFAYIGIGPDGWAAMNRVSSGLRSSSNVMNIAHSGKDVKRAYARAGGQSVMYACSTATDKGVMTKFWGKKKDEIH